MSEDLMVVQNLIYEIRGQKVMLDPIWRNCTKSKRKC